MGMNPFTLGVVLKSAKSKTIVEDKSPFHPYTHSYASQTQYFLRISPDRCEIQMIFDTETVWNYSLIPNKNNLLSSKQSQRISHFEN